MAARRAVLTLGMLLPALLGCRGGISKYPPVHPVLDMDIQQKLKAQSESTFPGWRDHRGSRLPPAGTVARSAFLGSAADLIATYDRDGDQGLDRLEAAGLKVAKVFAVADRNGDQRVDASEAAFVAGLETYKNADATFVAANPLPPTLAALERGRERFNIHCAVCHGRSGTGGVVKSRWPVKIPSLVADEDATTRARLLGMTPGELVGVLTEGKATMPSYAQQIRIEDRWAIAHYVKALQQHFNP